MCTQNPLHEDSNGFGTCDGTCDYNPGQLWDDNENYNWADEVTTEVPAFTWDRAVEIMDGGKSK